jgi:hypothetical protein
MKTASAVTAPCELNVLCRDHMKHIRFTIFLLSWLKYCSFLCAVLSFCLLCFFLYFRCKLEVRLQSYGTNMRGQLAVSLTCETSGSASHRTSRLTEEILLKANRCCFHKHGVVFLMLNVVFFYYI